MYSHVVLPADATKLQSRFQIGDIAMTISNPPESIAIERLQADEERRLKRMRLRALRESPEAFGSTYEDTIRRTHAVWKQQASDLPTWIAVLEGEDCGMVRTAPHADDSAAAFLISMWVAPEARGKGAGDHLVEAVLSWARAQGLGRVVLDVGDHNAPAIALYTRHGFNPTGRTSQLAPPRDHITEHERTCELA